MKRYVLKAEISAPPVASDFTVINAPYPECPEGGVVARTIYLSLDPYVGSVLRGRHLGERRPVEGDVAPARGIGEIVASKTARLAPGDLVRAEFGWRDAAIVPGNAERIDAEAAPLSAQLGAAGMPGLTAYAGLRHLAEVKTGDCVFVSSAAGAVGGTAGQIARILGARRVVGAAGSAEKCALVRSAYGFDDCLDYRAPDFRARLKEAFADGIDVYFDNVGGDLLNAALENLALYGRVVLCGLASQYQAETRPAGPNPGVYIGKRAQIFGLVVYDFMGEQAEFTRLAGRWIREGRLVIREDRAEGLAAAPALFERLMRGENVGKAIVAVGAEPRHG